MRPPVLKLLICFFLCLITLAAFWQVRHNDFINLDDNLYVTDNPHVQEGLTFKGILWAFTSPYAGHWHPMTWLSHMIDYDLYGLKPGGHHTTNLLFHIANTLLLFLLLLRMTGAAWKSGFVAALFALHPLHVESVAWVSERKDVLSTFFLMLTIGSYTFYVEKPRLNRYLLVALCFILSLMSKPMAVTLPLVLIVLDYWPLNRFRFPGTDGSLNSYVPAPSNRASVWGVSFRLIWEKTPLFFVTGILSFFTLLLHSTSGAISSFDKLPLSVRIENALVSYVDYIAKMIWPDPLAVLYPHPIVLPFLKVAGAALFLVMMSVLVCFARRKYPYLIVGWLWYLVTLIPVIGLVQAGVQGMADRFTYVPLIGLFIMGVYGISDVLKGRRLGKLALAILSPLLLLVLIGSTISHVKLWRDSFVLFRHTLSVTDNNYVIQNNLGVTLMRQGKDEEALLRYMIALKINPRFADGHYNLGVLLARQGKDQDAIVQFGEALRIKPNKAEAHNDLGVLLYKEGKLQEAAVHFSEAVQIDENFVEAQYNLGTALLHQERNDEALARFKAVLKLNPKNAKAYNNMGLVLASQGKIGEAILHYIEALRINPDYADAHCNLAALLARQGKEGEAVTHYAEALRIKPDDAQVHYELGVILTRQGKNQEAITHFTEALRIIRDYGEAYLALGMLYVEIGKRDLALRHYQVLRKINDNLANQLSHKILEHDKKRPRPEESPAGR